MERHVHRPTFVDLKAKTHHGRLYLPGTNVGQSRQPIPQSAPRQSRYAARKHVYSALSPFHLQHLRVPRHGLDHPIKKR